MRAQIKRRTAALGLFAGAVAAAMLAAACGGSSGASPDVATLEEGAAPSPDAKDSAPLDEDDQALVFAECMRDNGVDMPDPGPGRQGLIDALNSAGADHDSETMRQAISDCQDELPQYAQEEEHTQEGMLDFAECLREQGLDVSDNPFSDVHSGEIDQRDFVAAMEVCREELIGGDQ